MNIDQVFWDLGTSSSKHSLSKENYYLGTVSEVSKSIVKVQAENLSTLNSRILNGENLTPSTINFLVLINNVKGVLIARVKQNAIRDTDSIHTLMKQGMYSKIFPEIIVETLALLNPDTENFDATNFINAGVHDKVYVAPEKIIQKYYASLEVTKNIDEFPLQAFSSLGVDKSIRLAFKPVTLFSRHMMIIGTTGSGKSTSALSILDKMLKAHIKILIIDPTGEYADSFDSEVTNRMLGVDTNIASGSLSITQWVELLSASPGIQAPALMNAIEALRFQEKNCHAYEYVKTNKNISLVQKDIASLTRKDTSFDLGLLEKQLPEEAAVENGRGILKVDDFRLKNIRLLADRLHQKLETTKLQELFLGTLPYSLIDSLQQFLNDNIHSLRIDTSEIGSNDSTGGMVVDLISNYLFENKSEENRAFLIFIDEVHRYTEKETDDGNENYQGLITLAREGRKKGIYLLLTTQSPNDVSTVLLGQMGTLLIHRLTQPNEIYAINNFLDEKGRESVQRLGQGEAILTSVNLLHDVQLIIDKSDRSHHNGSPSLEAR
ncbi:ATP-binding protein [Secundilactobacillus paracollinoides]|uniref:AAA+ ATPase domain-containing protein n=1 Tax=Secundilactobacillus paracollinoides TaxID=240427 RepID=A0A1B2IUE6_9LACO|nr:ATP-binding protein [Secundilactobacillus paracollinoides]ANZ59894.1 hypothetical protein AYR61_00005 [Secundilactobacillus paracollinoides]ANZ65685.1 hypothetical protein AYR63_00010 [Secundilactobacillus paracollinoides]